MPHTEGRERSKQARSWRILASTLPRGRLEGPKRMAMSILESLSGLRAGIQRTSRPLRSVINEVQCSLVDLQEAKGSGQALIHEFFEAIGTGLSPDKWAWMSQQSTFLGVEHSFAALLTEGQVAFWPKQEIEDKIRAQIARFRDLKNCPPGDASKFRGVTGFAGEAQFGQLGKALMRPFKQRQYWDVPPWYLSKTMERSLDFAETLLDLRLERKVPVADDLRLVLVVASDAQVEPGSWPGGGALVLDPEDDSRWGGYFEFTAPA